MVFIGKAVDRMAENLRTIPMSEVEQHSNEESCWIIINGKGYPQMYLPLFQVYDVTTFLSEHPGGAEAIMEFAGKDATVAFEDVGHSKDAGEMTEEYLIGAKFSVCSFCLSNLQIRSNLSIMDGFGEITVALNVFWEYVGWRQTAGAVGVAWDKIQSDGILPEYSELNLTWVISECDNTVDAGAIIEWARNGVDVVLGPACPPCTLLTKKSVSNQSTAVISGVVAEYFNFPMVIWAPTFSSVLLSADDYPTMMAPTWSSISQARTLALLFERYRWSEVAVVYYTARIDAIPRCSLIIADLEVGLCCFT
uniref:Cytochrome b5 heme-binding domain-containing protein n=1 Tax=Angiostrongylus cantonensis TaxID=6313 RepID=A0A0K0D0W5_ANGCA